MVKIAGGEDMGTSKNYSSNKTHQYLVSVIITTRNRAHYLREAITSVLTVRGEKFDIELIVVDDGSTDDTPVLLEEYPIRCIRTPGVGMARARNLGLQAATGDFVTLLDDDDVWLPNNVAPHIELLEKHPEYGAAHAQAQLTKEDLTPFGNPVPAKPMRSGWIFEELLTYWPQVGTVVTRISVAREVGDLDPGLTGATDWDWLLRIARRYPIGRIEEPVMLFRQRGAPDEQLSWRRFPATVAIFHRHTRQLGLGHRLRLQPILWRHRGWWASTFLQLARSHVQRGKLLHACHSLSYAFRCSAPHAFVGCLRMATHSLQALR